MASACADSVAPRDRSLGDFQLSAVGIPGDSFVVTDFNDAGAFVGTVYGGAPRAFRFLGSAFQLLGTTSDSSWAVALTESGDAAVNRGGRRTAAVWRSTGTVDAFPSALMPRFGAATAVDIDGNGRVLLETYESAAPVVWAGSVLDTVGAVQSTFPSVYPSASRFAATGALIHICDEMAKKCWWEIRSETAVPAYAPLESCPYGGKFQDRIAPFGYRAARAVSDDGAVLGRANGTNCLWRPEGTLDVLAIDEIGRSLNADGWLVGFHQGTPVVWANGRIFRASDLLPDDGGWTIEEFLFVNDARRILARARRGADKSLLILQPVR